jgi:hypothetical protein
MWLFFGLPAIALLLMLILNASHSLDKLKENWNEYRCHPAFLPFAGEIRPDVTTAQNFTYCIGAMGNEIFKPILDVINGLFGNVNSSLGELISPLKLFRALFTRIRKFMLSFMATTFGKITNSTGAMTFYLVKIRDILNRFVGQGYIGAFLANVGIDFVMGFVTLCISIIKVFVYAMLAIAIILALFQPELLVFAITIASMIGASGF